MENGMESDLLDEEIVENSLNRISSEPTRAPELVRSKCIYLHSSTNVHEKHIRKSSPWRLLEEPLAPRRAPARANSTPTGAMTLSRALASAPLRAPRGLRSTPRLAFYTPAAELRRSGTRGLLKLVSWEGILAVEFASRVVGLGREGKLRAHWHDGLGSVTHPISIGPALLREI